MVLADDSGVNRTTTFTVANNNELNTMATTPDTGGSTSYTYDDWGRLTTETRGSVTKTYGWTKANLLASVDSSDSADTDVSYAYTGDLKRIFRFENSSLRNTYQYGAGFDVVAEGAWSGGAPIGQKTYADGLAEVDVTSTPAYSYLTHDHLGSTRGMWDATSYQTGSWEYTPYGSLYNSAGPSGVTHLYTGHDLEKATGNYFAPFRTMNPNTGRWLSRDPLGMVDGTNLYGYAVGNPLTFVDPMGQDLIDWFVSGRWNPSDDERQAAYYSLSCSRISVSGRGNIGPVTAAAHYAADPRQDRVTAGLQTPINRGRNWKSSGLSVSVNGRIPGFPQGGNPGGLALLIQPPYTSFGFNTSGTMSVGFHTSPTPQIALRSEITIWRRQKL